MLDYNPFRGFKKLLSEAGKEGVAYNLSPPLGGDEKLRSDSGKLRTLSRKAGNFQNSETPIEENFMNYLDEQLKNAYGFGVSDLKEEELHKILESLFRKIETKEDEKSKKQDYKKSINDIYEKAKQESRVLTDEEKTEIEKLKMQFSS
jgi:hypothetical protein